MTHLSKCITSGCLFSKVKRSLSLLQSSDRSQPYSSDHTQSHCHLASFLKIYIFHIVLNWVCGTGFAHPT
ncbi:hypothetical protein H6F68_09180 [Trichocoleus sp. FACHB-262]|nr:hypothetical protein [Trichocoleus sp. FACHB-262]